MSETNTKFSKEQIETYGELHNLIPSNNEAMIANMMRLEGMIQEIAISQMENQEMLDIYNNVSQKEQSYEKELFISVSTALAGGTFSITEKRTLEWANTICDGFTKRFK